MQKALALIFLPLFMIGFASNGLAEKLTLKALSPGKWTIYNSEGQDVGTLSREGQDPLEVEAGGYSILPKGGRYFGVVERNGDLQMVVRHATITPDEAQLYLDVLEAVRALKASQQEAQAGY